MKKVVAILLALVMLLTFAACAKPAETEAPAAEESATTDTATETPAAEEPAAEETPAADEAIVVDIGGESALDYGYQVASKASNAVMEAAKNGGEVTIGMSIPQLANPYFVSVKDGVQAMCDEYGYKLTIVDAGYDVAKQVSDLETFLNTGVTAVIACPIDSNALDDVTSRMNEAGIAVISFAQLVPNANAYFTVDEYGYGCVIGQNVVNWINDKLDGKGNVLIISQDNVEAVVRRGDGIQETIEKNCPDSVIVDRQAGDNPEKGMAIAENVMQAHPEVNVIIGNNDAGPLGAIEAVNAMNLDQSVLDTFFVGGGDATPEAVAKMKDPNNIYRASVSLDPYGTGEDCVNAIKAMIEAGGLPINEAVQVAFFNMVPVTQEMVLNGEWE